MSKLIAVLMAAIALALTAGPPGSAADPAQSAIKRLEEVSAGGRRVIWAQSAIVPAGGGLNEYGFVEFSQEPNGQGTIKLFARADPFRNPVYSAKLSSSVANGLWAQVKEALRRDAWAINREKQVFGEAWIMGPCRLEGAVRAGEVQGEPRRRVPECFIPMDFFASCFTEPWGRSASVAENGLREPDPSGARCDSWQDPVADLVAFLALQQFPACQDASIGGDIFERLGACAERKAAPRRARP